MKLQIRWPLGVVLFTLALSVLAAPSTPDASPPTTSFQSGDRVVKDLKERFADTARACPDGRAGIWCNGILVRAISRWDDPKFWNPTSDYIQRNAISFSYLREDVGSIRLAGTQGMIMQTLETPSQYVLAPRCVFPSDAFSLYRADGCGNLDFPKPCPEHGINDIPSWLAHYAATNYSFFCYLEPTAEWFQFSIDVRSHFDAADRGRWNEVVVAAWPQDIPNQLPIQAFFYTDDGLSKAQALQQSFFAATGRTLPIIRIALTEDGVFSYLPEDQKVRLTVQ